MTYYSQNNTGEPASAFTEKEQFIRYIKENITEAHYPDDPGYLRDMALIDNITDNDWLGLRLRQSSRVWVFTPPDPDLSAYPPAYRVLAKMFPDAGINTTFFTMNKFHQLEETQHDLLLVYFNLFQVPTTIKSAIDLCISRFLSHPPTLIQQLASIWEIETDHELLFFLRKNMMDGIRTLLRYGFLETYDCNNIPRS